MKNRKLSHRTGQFPSYANLPNLVLVKVFSYLTPRERFKAGRVCRRWYNLSRESILWNNLNVENMTSDQFLKLLPSIPAGVKQLRLSCIPFIFFIPKRLSEVIASLKKNSSSLETLILVNQYFAANIFCPSLSALWNDETISSFECYAKQSNNDECVFMPKLTVLSVRNSILCMNHFLCSVHWFFLHKIEVMDFTCSTIYQHEYLPLFRTFSNLKSLYLSHISIEDMHMKALLENVKGLTVLDLEGLKFFQHIFPALRQHGQSLQKLYLGRSNIRGFDLVGELFANETCFPRLEELCFRCTGVTGREVENILNCCHTLKHVHVCLCLISEEWLQSVNCKIFGKFIFEENADCLYFCNHFKRNHFPQALVAFSPDT